MGSGAARAARTYWAAGGRAPTAAVRVVTDEARRGSAGGERAPNGIVDVDDAVPGEIRPGKQPRLGRAVGLHAAVVVEMIARQVGEGRGVKAHARDPRLVERVGLETSMQTHSAPRARSVASWRCTLTASGVVCRVERKLRRPETEAECADVGRGRGRSSSDCASSHAQVVLPLVPVMPATVSCAEGAPKKRSAMTPACSLKWATPATNVPGGGCGTDAGCASPRVVEHRARAARQRLRREAQSVMRATPAGEEQRPRGGRAAVRPSHRSL